MIFYICNLQIIMKTYVCSIFFFLVFFLSLSSFAQPLSLSNVTDGESVVFEISDQNTNFNLSEEYDSIGVKAPINSIVLFSADNGKNWNALPFNTDSKTETTTDPLFYSDLYFLETPSNQFQFQVKMAGDIETIEFFFIKDHKPAPLLNASAGEAHTSIPYPRDTWFLLENGIVPRENWGAEEKYRYTWGNTFVSVPSSGSSTKTQRQIECEQKVKNYPNDFTKEKIVSSDGNGALVWPYQYSPEIQKIIIHHTADNKSIQNGKSPESIMRAMYTYHANGKGWGDVGYHFVISPDGAIFEGKAGGDFIVGGHTYCANTQTIGIALMGNFEETIPPIAQTESLKNLLTSLSQKYQIDLGEYSAFHGKYDSNLLGHKDFVATACPGQNLYSQLSNLRTHFSQNNTPATISTPQPTPDSNMLSPVIVNGVRVPYTIITPPPRPSQNTNFQTPLPNPLPQNTPSASTQESPSIISGNTISQPSFPAPTGPIRIKLSYESDMAQIRGGLITVEINNTAVIRKRSRVIITKVGNQLYFDGMAVNKIRVTEVDGDGILKISSWNRPLPWDPSKDDNEFRGTLEFRMINGEMVTINELPLEEYLQGIAEVSHTAPVEKQKAIAVVARSYAQFYMDPANEKFPGMPYHGDDSPERFQKYRGFGYEQRNPSFIQAVQNTQGQVVTYNGALVKTPFFSESDGMTKSAQSVWGWTNTPYLQAKDDSFCKNGNGTQKGHGVGMSGCGAETLATMGYSYLDILKYYYTGVEIQ